MDAATAGRLGVSGGDRPRRLVEAGLVVMLLFAPVSISGTQVGLALAAAGALWQTLATRRLPRTPLDEPILVLLVVTFASVLFSASPAGGLRKFMGSWTMLSFYLVVGWLGDPGRLERYLRLLLVPATIFGAYGILQHFTGWNLFGSGSAGLHALVFGQRTVYLPRGGFSHYQTYANVFFLIFCLAGALAAGSAGRTRARRAAVAVFLSLVVVFTFTRGIWISLVAALAIFVWIFARRAIPTIVGICAAAMLALLLVPSSVRTRALSMTEAGTNVERLLIWETAWNMIRDRPLLGVGIGNFRRAQQDYLREEVPLLMTRTHAHNIWLQVAVERGILGLLALLWLTVALFGQALRAVGGLRSGGGLPLAFAAGGLAGLTGFFLDGFVQNNFGDSQVATLFWVVAGIVVVCGRAVGHSRPRADACEVTA